MATITKLEQQFKEGKPSGYKVNLSDGTFGYLVEKGSDAGLKEGDEVTYTSETPAGKTYKKITLHKAGGAPVAQVQQPSAPKVNPPVTSGIKEAKSLSEMKFEARICNMKLAVGCLEAGKFTRAEVVEAFAEWNSVFDASLDELKSK